MYTLPTSHNKKKYCLSTVTMAMMLKKYIWLNDEIEDLIYRGYLGKYMHGKEHHTKVAILRKSPIEAEINNQPTRGRVNMISWGARLGGVHDEKDTLKRLWSNNVINFFDDNLWGIQNPMMTLLLSQQQ